MNYSLKSSIVKTDAGPMSMICLELTDKSSVLLTKINPKPDENPYYEFSIDEGILRPYTLLYSEGGWIARSFSVETGETVDTLIPISDVLADERVIQVIKAFISTSNLKTNDVEQALKAYGLTFNGKLFRSHIGGWYVKLNGKVENLQPISYFIDEIINQTQGNE